MSEFMEYGLIGRGISHSFSAEFFNDKFRREGITAKYSLFDLKDISELKELIDNHPDLKGLNVTSPYKRKVIPYLDDLSPEATELNAVNVIKIERTDGASYSLKGYNTDCLGFQKTLHNILSRDAKAAILGSGGASSAVAFGLSKENIANIVVSRNPINGQISYKELNERLPEFDLIINATPLGMFPETEGCPDIDFSKISQNQIFYDLIYNPAETVFLKKAASMGSKTLNGFEMLLNQAKLAWNIWNNK